ncbi:uncharacterized protein PAC_05072 [Phialocephala subalpina]|uniref:Uncharacterized protein n=1 Tax=Phialocephala subalpina TaxID=576137 RepID=A0A1L7WR01_9HELO|nr:uncharacterized protein PAC_05072 [Phialocephala subalpina]
MAKSISSNTHNCPKKSTGKCIGAKLDGRDYCSVHQTLCPGPKCKLRKHLKTEECPSCKTDRVEAAKKQAAIDKKKKEDDEKEEKERRKKQSEADKTFNKKPKRT